MLQALNDDILYRNARESSTRTHNGALAMVQPIGTRLLQRWIYVMVKLGEDFLLVNLAAENSAKRMEADYGPDFLPFLSGFLAALDGGPWPPGSYYPGGLYRRRLQAGDPPLGMLLTQEAVQPFFLEELLVDEEGSWFSGEKRLSGRILDFFLEQLEFDPVARRYRVRYRLENSFEVNYLRHRSPPFRVRKVVPSENGPALLINNGQTHTLRPQSLWLDDRERLHAGIGDPTVGARFEEPARWELLKDAEMDDGRWVVTIGGQRVSLAPDSPWPFADDPPEPTEP